MEFINHIKDWEIFESPIAVIALLSLLLFSSAAHFTLFKFLIHYLNTTTVKSGKVILNEKFKIVQNSHRILTIVGYMGVFGTTLIVSGWFVPHSSGNFLDDFHLFAEVVSPMVVILHLLFLVYIQLVVSISYFEIQCRDILPKLSYGKCVIRLKNQDEFRCDLLDTIKTDSEIKLKVFTTSRKIKTIKSGAIDQINFMHQSLGPQTLKFKRGLEVQEEEISRKSTA